MKRSRLIDRPRTVNIGNLMSKLRRLRTEVAQLLQQIDEALVRVETEGPAAT